MGERARLACGRADREGGCSDASPRVVKRLRCDFLFRLQDSSMLILIAIASALANLKLAIEVERIWEQVTP